NNPRQAGSLASSGLISARSPKPASMPRRERREDRECRRELSRKARPREKPAPKLSQTWDQAALPAHKNFWLPKMGTAHCVLQKPGRADTHRKRRNCLLV